ncbi:hypothetical protein K488DRAFT_73270 [Vararia minispora EC-137]|uniref:Uncharacterized protein n=1 Tax=Vararia minispora EC-137 TaxID=1314806 RepID=A0ACB8QB77_9AGAM|nr:hypothetical protein K488DRAFT_73270 [Vararia minispora EC-137]
MCRNRPHSSESAPPSVTIIADLASGLQGARSLVAVGLAEGDRERNVWTASRSRTRGWARRLVSLIQLTACHLLPAFTAGNTRNLLAAKSSLHDFADGQDWAYYYVSRIANSAGECMDVGDEEETEEHAPEAWEEEEEEEEAEGTGGDARDGTASCRLNVSEDAIGWGEGEQSKELLTSDSDAGQAVALHENVDVATGLPAAYN